jgi:hypothetical protein
MKPFTLLFLGISAAAIGQGPATPPTEESRPPAPAPAATFGAPAVFILCGSPGDEDHHANFEKRLTRLRKWFTQRAALPSADVKVYYGPESAGYAGTAGRENIQKVCAAAVELTKAGRPVWFLLTGHANDAPGDVRFNLPGGDLSGKELAGWLSGAAAGDGAAPLNIILATACSGRAIKHLAGPGRSIIAAANATEGADESVFADGLVQILEDGTGDADKDGSLSMTEIFTGSRAAVLQLYQSKGYLLTEHACLDGDGDGRATQRPSEADATAAAGPGHSLKLTSGGSS